MLVRNCLTWLFLIFSSHAYATEACPFCPMQGQTLVMEVKQARFVLYGLPSNPQIKREADGREISTTDFTIEEVVKSDPFLKNKKTLTLPRYIPPATTGSEKLLVFCDLHNDLADTYLYLSARDGALVKYLKEAIQLDEKDVARRLHFFFNNLDHADNEIAADAYKEFGKADYTDVVKLVKEYGNEGMKQRLRSWMKDPNTAIYRYGLLGLMLGLCGDKSDTSVFQALLTDPDKSLLGGIDGVLAGYILVDKEAGWKHTMHLVSHPEVDFNKRYAALRTLRFLWDTHTGHVAPRDLLAAMGRYLEQADIADLAIEDLRKWKQWKFTSRIIELGKLPGHQASSIVQRAILRYMLAVPGDKVAEQYVAAMRREHPDRVKDALEILELEKSSSEAAKEPSKAK